VKNHDIEEEEDVEISDNLNDEEEQVPFRYSITSYGADFLIDGIVRRMKDGDIIIPDFQRGFVWSYGKSSRFVESLLLGLPVPGIFLSKDPVTAQLIVIDGQQRLRTLQFFYNGYFLASDRIFALSGIESDYSGLTYDSLNPEDRRRLDNSILHATIVQQDEPSSDNSSIYLIFERLNTGGMVLRPQEIRACIYHGKFNELLKKLNQNDEWRQIFGGVHKRMRDQELILRFFAMYFDIADYKPPMKDFLNKYMAKNQQLEIQSEEKLTALFESTMKVAFEFLSSDAFKPYGVINAAAFDSIMIGIARRLLKGSISDSKKFSHRYRMLLRQPSYLDAINASTADPENINLRISKATQTFTDVE